ncbi:hypothetical protein [Massilia glaciei]|uniref:hypothetical protein n=1 Tax=Massilia glaciei TaxID=1524097 RepID=UPI0015E812E9|nr:hypothetical protein [Massilia glaciei]
MDKQDTQEKQEKNGGGGDDGTPKFGRLLLVLGAAVVVCGVLTYVMGTYFPRF